MEVVHTVKLGRLMPYHSYSASTSRLRLTVSSFSSDILPSLETSVRFGNMWLLSADESKKVMDNTGWHNTSEVRTKLTLIQLPLHFSHEPYVSSARPHLTLPHIYWTPFVSDKPASIERKKEQLICAHFRTPRKIRSTIKTLIQKTPSFFQPCSKTIPSHLANYVQFPILTLMVVYWWFIKDLSFVVLLFELVVS